MQALCDILESLILKYNRISVVGGFNAPKINWLAGAAGPHNAGAEGVLCSFTIEHNLTQTASKPTRGKSLLDIIFISSHFVNNEVNNLAPVG